LQYEWETLDFETLNPKPLQYEWETLDFENDEKVREEFMESPEVIRDEMINEVRYLTTFFRWREFQRGDYVLCVPG